ncbi:hypothetical protein RFK25_00005, partial [Streptococcus sp. SS-4456]
MKNNKLLIFITDIEVIERISSIIMEFLLFLINSHVVKSSATSSLITRVPEVKLFGLAQTGIL